MSKYKMVVSDLDGTLLKDVMTVSDENVEAIQKMDEMGITFVISTGRCDDETPKVLKNCKGIKYYINSVGSSVRNAETGELDLVLISPEKYKEITKILNQYRHHITAHIDGYNYVDSAELGDEVIEKYNVHPLHLDLFRKMARRVDNFEEYTLDGKSVEFLCCFFASDEELFECRERLMALGGLSFTSSAKFNLEIVAEGALKGDAVTRLAKKLGIEKEEVIAVGDSRNDISLLSVSGMPLAVENANDALKKHAKKVICNYKDHVAKYILENII